MIETAARPAIGREFALTRTFDAALEQVWHAFTRPEHLKHWWGPRGCAIEIAQFDFRPGGKFVYCMSFPGGRTMWGRFVFEEIEAPHRLVWINSFSNEQGGVNRNPYDPAWPLETLTAVHLAEQGG